VRGGWQGRFSAEAFVERNKSKTLDNLRKEREELIKSALGGGRGVDRFGRV